MRRAPAGHPRLPGAGAGIVDPARATSGIRPAKLHRARDPDRKRQSNARRLLRGAGAGSCCWSGWGQTLRAMGHRAESVVGLSCAAPNLHCLPDVVRVGDCSECAWAGDGDRAMIPEFARFDYAQCSHPFVERHDFRYGHQRYRCRFCHRTFTPASSKHSPASIGRALLPHFLAASKIKPTAQTTGHTCRTVARYFRLLQTARPVPCPCGRPRFHPGRCFKDTNIAGLMLASTSPYRNAGTDGLDIGANVAAVAAAVAAIVW